MNHQYDYVTIGYHEDGYYSSTTSISGANDRVVKVTHVYMTTLTIATVGQSAVRELSQYVSNPTFTFKGESEINVTAFGNWNTY